MLAYRITEKPMPAVRQAVATRCFGKPIRRSIEQAARMGAAGVQLDIRHEVHARDLSGTGKRQFLHTLGQFNLSVAATFLPTRRAIYEKEHLDQRISAISAGMQFTRDLGADVLVVSAGPMPAEDSQEFQTLVEVLTELAAHGNHVGTTLCLRSGSTDPAVLRSLIEKIETGPLGVDFDPVASVQAGRSAIEDFTTLHQVVRHFRATDCVLAANNSYVEVAVGRGQIPWMELVVMLDEAKFSGWMTVERNDGGARTSDISAGLQFLKAQMPITG